MSDELVRAVATLRQLAPKLNQATNNAKAIVESVETFLNQECSIGLPVAIPLSEEVRMSEDGFLKASELVYDRIDGRFQIGVRTYCWTDDGETRSRPRILMENAWSAAPRQERLEAFARLPDLIKAVCVAVEETMRKTASTAVTIDDMMHALQSSAMSTMGQRQLASVSRPPAAIGNTARRR